MINSVEMLAKVQKGIDFAPLKIQLANLPTQRGTNPILEVTGEGETFHFEAILLTRSSARVMEEGFLRAQQKPNPNPPPLLITPFVNEPQIKHLMEKKVSGIDLCGNGIISVAGKLFVYRTGEPNRYPDSEPTKYAYRGMTSLVSRVFFCRSAFASLSEIEDEIRSRGGRVVLSTISKALKRLEDDLIVERKDNQIRLLQPEKLLEKLAESYRAPKVTQTVTLRFKPNKAKAPGRQVTSLNESGFDSQMGWLFPNQATQVRQSFTGLTSANRYAVMGRLAAPILYTNQIDSLLEAWKDLVEESSRFIDLEIRQTNDESLFFDTRIQGGLPLASPVQSFLECWAGDKRTRETALDIKQGILKDVFKENREGKK